MNKKKKKKTKKSNGDFQKHRRIDAEDPDLQEGAEIALNVTLLGFLNSFCQYLKNEHPLGTVRTDVLEADATAFMRKVITDEERGGGEAN